MSAGRSPEIDLERVLGTNGMRDPDQLEGLVRMDFNALRIIMGEGFSESADNTYPNSALVARRRNSRLGTLKGFGRRKVR